MMKPWTIAVLFAACAFAACAPEPDEQHALPAFGEQLPPGYELVYETDFADDRVFEDLEFTDPNTWRRVDNEDGAYLELFRGVGSYRPEVRSPRSFALLMPLTVGDFVLEMDVESTELRAGAHRDTCYFFGFTDPANFYYVHIASAADPNAHNIFRVQDAPRTNIASFVTDGVDWGVAIRHRVRIERTVADGLIRVFFNDLDAPIMEATDTSFDFGHIGFGSFDDRCRFYALRLYAPETQEATGSFFGRKEAD